MLKSRCPVMVTTRPIENDADIRGIYYAKEDRIVLRSGYSPCVYAHELAHSFMNINATSKGSDVHEEESIADLSAYFLSKKEKFSFEYGMKLHFRKNFSFIKKENQALFLAKVCLRVMLIGGYRPDKAQLTNLVNQLLAD